MKMRNIIRLIFIVANVATDYDGDATRASIVPNSGISVHLESTGDKSFSLKQWTGTKG